MQYSSNWLKRLTADLIHTNLVIYGRGTLVQSGGSDECECHLPSNRGGPETNGESEGFANADPYGNPDPDANPTPSKFGTPSVITSRVPYLITSGTTISTEPTITTNGVTDFGKIWRGHAQDGRLSAFIFGSTSAFDTGSGFNTELNGQNSSGGAGY